MNLRIREWLEQSRIETPVLVVDLEVVRQQYRNLQNAFPHTDIHYAVKANPKFDILRRLAREGAGFYISSPTQLDNVMQTGVDPLKIVYLHAIKKARDIAYAWQHGVRNFGFDSLEELEKIAKNAPCSHVFYRLNLLEGQETILKAERLLRKAKNLDLIPYGLSFHLGSMQTDVKAYLDILDFIAPFYHHLKSQAINLQKINIGGGFPVDYIHGQFHIDAYGHRITKKANELFGENKLMIGPGRLLVAEAGVIAAEVISVEKEVKKVYLDVGYYNGLSELNEPQITYPLRSDNAHPISQTYDIFGPSGDIYDQLGKDIELPLSLQAGDKIFVQKAGAYTSFAKRYSMQGFVFPRVVCLPVAEDMPLFAQKVINLSDARMGLKKTLWG